MRPNVSASLRDALVGEMTNLRAFAVSLCGDRERADDLVQETLFKAWNHLDSFREGTNLKAWLFTILRNTYFSERRKRRREVEDADGSYAATLASRPEQHGHMDMQDFRVALKRLPDDQREALILVGAAGFSYEEAARSRAVPSAPSRAASIAPAIVSARCWNSARKRRHPARSAEDGLRQGQPMTAIDLDKAKLDPASVFDHTQGCARGPRNALRRRQAGDPRALGRATPKP